MTSQHQYEALKLAISDAIFGKSMDTVDDLMKLVTAYAATVEREAARKARIDEIGRAAHNDCKPEYFTDRLAALQEPQEQDDTPAEH